MVISNYCFVARYATFSPHERSLVSFSLSLPPSTVHRATYFEKGGREAIVLRLISLLACLPIAFDRDLFPPSLLPLLTSSSLFPLFPPPPSMNANSSIDTLSISHFVPPIPACLLSPPSLPGAVQCFGLSREELPVAAVA